MELRQNEQILWEMKLDNEPIRINHKWIHESQHYLITNQRIIAKYSFDKKLHWKKYHDQYVTCEGEYYSIDIGDIWDISVKLLSRAVRVTFLIRPSEGKAFSAISFSGLKINDDEYNAMMSILIQHTNLSEKDFIKAEDSAWNHVKKDGITIPPIYLVLAPFWLPLAFKINPSFVWWLLYLIFAIGFLVMRNKVMKNVKKIYLLPLGYAPHIWLVIMCVFGFIGMAGFYILDVKFIAPLFL